MNVSKDRFEQIGYLKPFFESVTTGAKCPEEILRTLSKYGIDWYVTEKGTLMIRYWQIGAEGFVSPERAAMIRSTKESPGQADELDWLSKNLQNVRSEFGNNWIAVCNNAVVAAAPNLPDLMNRVTGLDRPLVTFIPAEPVVWTFTYAH